MLFTSMMVVAVSTWRAIRFGDGPTVLVDGRVQQPVLARLHHEPVLTASSAALRPLCHGSGPACAPPPPPAWTQRRRSRPPPGGSGRAARGREFTDRHVEYPARQQHASCHRRHLVGLLMKMMVFSTAYSLSSWGPGHVHPLPVISHGRIRAVRSIDSPSACPAGSG